MQVQKVFEIVMNQEKPKKINATTHAKALLGVQLKTAKIARRLT